MCKQLQAFKGTQIENETSFIVVSVAYQVKDVGCCWGLKEQIALWKYFYNMFKTCLEAFKDLHILI